MRLIKKVLKNLYWIIRARGDLTVIAYPKAINQISLQENQKIVIKIRF